MDASLRERLAGIFAEAKTIAVVGRPLTRQPASAIPRYLQRQGYRILPVNPRGGELLGEPVARSLAEVDGPIDVVEVFRPAEERRGSPARRSRSGPRCCGCSSGSCPRRRSGARRPD